MHACLCVCVCASQCICLLFVQHMNVCSFLVDFFFEVIDKVQSLAQLVHHKVRHNPIKYLCMQCISH